MLHKILSIKFLFHAKYEFMLNLNAFHFLSGGGKNAIVYIQHTFVILIPFTVISFFC